MNATAGTQISWSSTTYTVIAVSALEVLLRDAEGAELRVSLEELNRTASPATPSGPMVPTGASTEEALPREVCVWQASLERIMSMDADGLTVEARVEREREHLSRVLGSAVTSRTVFRKLALYREEGIAGLLDKRRSRATTSSVDPRVIEVLGEVLASRAKSSTVSRAVLIADISRRVRDRYGDEVAVPSRSTLYRLLDAEDRGRHSFGSANTRETLSRQPKRDYVGRIALRPGEQVQIDSTPLDVMVRIDDQTIGRPELTIMVDVATRSVLAAVLRPESTKSMDLVVVLARALVPYARRPEGARETRRLISSAWAEDALVDQERYERLRDSQPFIFPETITTDRGKKYLSAHFRSACQTLGISLITSAPHTPTDKSHVERTFESIASLLLQHARGYVGRSVEYRGKDVEAQSATLLTIAQMQELLEDWIAVEWQNRSHDSLRDPLHPTITLSPNEMCRAFRQVAPELHVPLTRDAFIGLLPVMHRRINRYGVTMNHRVYDSARLAEFRRRHSPSRLQDGRWPVRVDPYNLYTVWLDLGDEDVPLAWTNRGLDAPMLGDVWRHARDAYRADDGQVRAEAAELTATMKRFAEAGNAVVSPRQAARVKAVAADPMNPTSVLETTRPEVLSALEPARPATAAADNNDASTDTGSDTGEAWPHRGGFAFVTDDDTDDVDIHSEDWSVQHGDR